MNSRKKNILNSGVPALAAVFLAASCAVGPNFKKPDAPPGAGYTSTPPGTTASATNVGGGQAQHFVTDLDISGEWWTLFHSKPLNELINRALTNNPNLKAAQAALKVAHETLLAQKGVFYPSADASFSANRAHTAEDLSPLVSANNWTTTLYTPEVTVSYSPDVFGLNRRTVESFHAQEEQQRFALAATYIALSANVVSAAVNEASLRAQIAATTNLIGETGKALDILRAQFDKGYASRLDLAAQESQLAQLAATLPPLVKQLQQQRDALDALLGVFPNQDPAEKFELSSLQLPQSLPLSLPSKLVAQRPDVRQAEEAWHAACAQVGVAIANRLPNITLSASAGSTALALDQIFSQGTGFWGIGGQLSQPLFHGFTLLHQQRAAEAAYKQAGQQYRATVLAAFQNVADTLHALEQDANALKAATEAERAARTTFDVTQSQLQAGYANYLSLVVAETAYQQAVSNLVQAQANRYSDTAALFLALGGGWWNHADFTKY